MQSYQRRQPGHDRALVSFLARLSGDAAITGMCLRILSPFTYMLVT